MAALAGESLLCKSLGTRLVDKGYSCPAQAPPPEKRRKETLLSSELGKYLEKKVRVKFQGGREATGILKGYDQLLNLVLDGTVEHVQDPDDPFKLTDETRLLGLVVCRGTAVVLVCPADSMEPIANPFMQQQEAI